MLVCVRIATLSKQMSDSPPDDHDDSRAMASFEQWIEQQADTQGVSRQELFEQLVSSYWTVNEMAELIDEPGDDPLPTSVPDRSDDGEDADPEELRVEDVKSELEDVDSIAELRDRLDGLETELDLDRERNQSRDELIETLADRVKWLEADLSPDRREQSVRSEPSDGGAGRRSRPAPRLRERVATLDDRLESIEDELEDEQGHNRSQDEFLEAVADRLARIESRIDEVASETAANRESLSGEYDSLDTRIDGIETDIERLSSEVETVQESVADEYDSLTDRLDDLEADVDGRHKQLAGEQKRLRSRIDAEFDDLETILEYLVTQTDDLDAGIAAVEQRHEEQLSTLQWEREALRSLKAAAAEHDAHAGECEACGEQVDLDLLAEPYCSACGSLLTGIEARDKWLFFADIIVTADEDRRGGRQSGSTVPSDGSATGVPDAGRSGDRRDKSGSRQRSDEAESERPPSTGAPDPATSSPTRSTEAGGEAEPDESSLADSESLDFGRGGSGSEAPAPDDDPLESAFMFGDSEAESTSETSSAADTDTDSDADTEPPVDAPFGDLDDLKREEQPDGE